MKPAASQFDVRTIATNGIRLRCIEGGDGPLVLLLHGFPEFSYSWRHQLPALVNAGYRVVAPDLRGYNESDAPSGIAAYRTHELVADVAGLIREYGPQPSFVVGHDWGGLIAWRLASLHPELVRNLVIVNAPHPAAFKHELIRNPVQWLRSSYTLFFQLPWLPEYVLSRNDFAVLERSWRQQPSRPEAFTSSDIHEYKSALAKHGLTGALNYYRALRRYPGDLFGGPQKVTVPTLLIWGERDPFLSASVIDKFQRWVPNLVCERFPDVSHWVHLEQPQRVNLSLIDFFHRIDVTK